MVEGGIKRESESISKEQQGGAKARGGTDSTLSSNNVLDAGVTEGGGAGHNPSDLISRYENKVLLFDNCYVF